MKLFIGLPIVGGVSGLFLNSMLKLMEQRPCDLDVRIHQGSGLMLSRNSLVKQFLASDCERLLFIDGDIIFEPHDVERIISHDEDIVGGFYAKKNDGPLEWVCAAHEKPLTREDGLESCTYVGTGFMCIQRNVFEVMLSRCPEIRFGPTRDKFDFFTLGIWRADENLPYLTEDYYFCKRWLALGGSIYADTKVALQHFGDAIYPLQSQRHPGFFQAVSGNPKIPLQSI